MKPLLPSRTLELSRAVQVVAMCRRARALTRTTAWLGFGASRLSA